MRRALVLVLGAMAVFALSQVPAARLRSASEAIGQGLANLEVRGWRWLNDNPARHAALSRLTAAVDRDIALAQSWLASTPGGASASSYTIAGVRIQIAGAAAVRPLILHLASGISVAQIERTLGMAFQAPISIRLFQHKSSYDGALVGLGVTGAQAGVMVDRTAGVEAGSGVYLPLFNDAGRYALANVLTHELTHVLFYQNNLSNILPTWLNEGTAWYEGLTAERSLSRSSADSQLEQGLQGVAVASASGAALPLQATEAELLRAPYDVEIQDYEAVALLVKLHGFAHYADFLREAGRTGVSAAFRNMYGMSLGSFIGAFAGDLHSITLAMQNSPLSGRALAPFVPTFLPQPQRVAYGGGQRFSRVRATA